MSASVAEFPRLCLDVRAPISDTVAQAQHSARCAQGPITPTQAALLTAAHWAPGTTLRYKFRDGTIAARDSIRAAMATWEKFANIKFKQVVMTERADLRISFDPGGSWSYIGTGVLSIPASQPTMNIGWPNDFARDLHELGHTLGLVHEHQLPDAAIPWNRSKVLAYYAGPPNFWPASQTIANVLDRLDASTLTNGGFDRQSIMLYPILPELLTDPTKAVGWNQVLSEKDKKVISTIYPKNS